MSTAEKAPANDDLYFAMRSFWQETRWIQNSTGHKTPISPSVVPHVRGLNKNVKNRDIYTNKNR